MSEKNSTTMKKTLGLTGITVNAMALIAPGAFLWMTYQLQAAATAPKPESRVSVIFVEPQKFTDVKQDSWGDNSPALLAQIKNFLCETGESYVSAGLHLEIKVTDISLAG